MTPTPGSIRVGFILTADLWMGGRNYLRNLLSAVLTLPAMPITPVLIVGKQTEVGSADFSGVEVVQSALLDRGSLAWLTRKLVAGAVGRDVLLMRLLERHRISVLSHAAPLGKQSSIKTLGWIPDFQHIHLPDFFSPAEREALDRRFRKLCQSDRIIVSSACARNDLTVFSPGASHKAELLQFVARPAAAAHATGLETLQQRYGFTGAYFLLPNQFWKHKNHRLVLNALQILSRHNKPVLVLATGATSDFRDPAYFASLMEYAAESGMLDHFRVLGQIPYDDLGGLMQHAIAIVNPSRFEGWSTSVEEAKSMGKQVVLSSIPVHLEQAPERAFYFPPDDAAGLAEALEQARTAFDPVQDKAAQAGAWSRFPGREHEFAQTYLEIVSRAIDG